MKKIITGLIAILFGVSACSFKAEHIEPLSKQEVTQLMATYYQAPNAEKLVQMLAYFDDTDALQKDKTLVAPLEGILAGLAVNNAPVWKTITQEIVWENNMLPVMKDMPNRIALLRRMTSNPNTAVTDAAALDFLWGAFASTGDPKFVQVIIRTKNSVEIDPIVRSAAAWSLYSQSKTHPIVARELKNAPAAPDEFMQKIEAKFQNPA